MRCRESPACEASRMVCSVFRIRSDDFGSHFRIEIENGVAGKGDDQAAAQVTIPELLPDRGVLKGSQHNLLLKLLDCLVVLKLVGMDRARVWTHAQDLLEVFCKHLCIVVLLRTDSMNEEKVISWHRAETPW